LWLRLGGRVDIWCVFSTPQARFKFFGNHSCTSKPQSTQAHTILQWRPAGRKPILWEIPRAAKNKQTVFTKKDKSTYRHF
jgi:hypothetical protein